MEKIILSTKKELEIYINPMRQQLLGILEKSKEPMTPKMLADKMNISASSVQHHIGKLLSLGVLELHHTKQINGITARFYKPTYVVVQIGLEKDDSMTSQREVYLQEKVARTYDGFMAQKKKVLEGLKEKEQINQGMEWQLGDILTGVMHLTGEESKELFKLISGYLETHSTPSSEKSPWEYALILYNAGEDLNE